MSQQENLEYIKSQELKPLSGIPIAFFSKRSNKTTKLINNIKHENHLTGQNKWYDFSLEDEVYVSHVKIYTEGYGKYHDAEINWDGLFFKGVSSKTVRISNDIFIVEINNFIKKLSFKPDKKFMGTVIKSIEFIGYTKQEFLRVLSDFSEIEVCRNKILDESNESLELVKKQSEMVSQLEESKLQYEEEIHALELQKIEYNDELITLKTSKDEVQHNITERKSVESDIQKRIESLDDSIDLKKNEQRNLNTEISDKTSVLKNLKENINIFPSEIGGFVDQGANSIKKYVFLTIIPLLILVVVTFALFSNAADLTVLYLEPENISIWSVILTRIPFVLIAITLIHACYKIAKIFINEIIKINSQRLSLSKISIIATDVSNASIDGLGFSDEEIYQYRTKLKMELLREHLKEYISEDYSYKTESIKPSTKTELDDETIPETEE